MLHDLGEILWVQGVQDVEEILAGRALALWENGREEGTEVSIFFELGPERLDTELIVVWHRNVFDGSLLQQLLSAGEDILEEVLVDRFLIGQIILDYRGVRNME